MTIRLAAAAERDLTKTLAWLAERDPAAADALREQVGRTLALLETGGLDGPLCVLPSGQRVRRFYAHPFWIYYQRAPGSVLRVLRLYHHARAPLT